MNPKLNTLRPGDVIGFSSHSPIDALINLATWGVPGIGISHVAIAAPHPEWAGQLLLYESTTQSPLACAITGKSIEGVQAHRIDDRLSNYNGALWRYELERPLSPTKAACLGEYCGRMIGIPYDAVGAFRSRELTCVERWLFRKEDVSAVFCSEFAAAALRYTGELRSRNVSRFNPNRLCRELVRRGVCKHPQRIAFGS